ncbi:MAG TPA: phospholipid carrier-dependent glycosyltransferase [Mycobacteriales bacterium]|nr:phospholipid carrier-dependent glycosyltransferase [Mycobacteriales bacterium]
MPDMTAADPATIESPSPQAAVGAAPPRRSAGSALRGVARRNALFLGLLAGGLVLRVIVELAYLPALLFPDSYVYLDSSAHPLQLSNFRPGGYPALLAVLHATTHNLAAVSWVQHGLGLATAAMVYALLVRLRVPRWAAALATLPVLVDPLWLSLEQFVMADIAFIFVLTAALTVIAWRAPTPARCVVAGLLLAFAVVIRLDGLLLFVPVLVYLLLQRRRWSVRLVSALTLIAAFTLPIVGYASLYDTQHGSFNLSDYNGLWLYGRVARFADCRTAAIPVDERYLCPTQPPGQRPVSDWYIWNPKSPAEVLPIVVSHAILTDFAERIIRHQPGAFVGAVLSDFWRDFSPTRSTRATDPPTDGVFNFGPGLPKLTTESRLPVPPAAFIRPYGGGPMRVNPGLAGFLHGYRRDIETPGSLVGVLLLAGMLAGMGVGRARRPELRGPSLLFAFSALALLGVAVAGSQFSWRYTLPALALAPAAGALAVTCWRGRASSPPAARLETGARESRSAPPAS